MIGKVILSILGLILLLILLVLFLPLRYEIQGSYREEFAVKGRVSWLLRFVQLSFRYTENFFWHLHILWFYLMGNDKRQEKIDNEEAEIKKKPYSEEDFFEDSSDRLETSEDLNLSEASNTKSDFNSYTASKPHTERRKLSDENAENKKANKAGFSLEKLKKIFRLMQREEFKRSFELIKKSLSSLLKGVSPKKFHLKANYSLGSPDYTALLFGMICLFPYAYRNKWIVEPDFEEEAFADVEFHIKGKVTIIRLLIIFIRLFKNQDCRKCYKYMKKIMEG